MTFSSSSTDWIWAYKTGSPLNTDSQSASISQHDNRGYGSVKFDSTAQGDLGTNPFLSIGAAASACSSSAAVAATPSASTMGLTPTTSSSGSAAMDSSAPTQTGYYRPHDTGEVNKAKRSIEAKAFLIARELATHGLTAEAIVKRVPTDCVSAIGPVTAPGRSSGVTTGSKGVSTGSLITIHGILAGFIFTVLFPFGGIMIRLLGFQGLLWAHGILQIVGYIGYIVSMGLGAYTATRPYFVNALTIQVFF